MLLRNSPKVPSQRCARCRRLKELRVSMKSAVVPLEVCSAELGRIVLPSRWARGARAPRAQREGRTMRPSSAEQTSSGTTADFIDTLSSFSRLHRAQRWEGTFGEFLSNILPGNAAALARSSHEYIWDMLRWHGRAAQPDAPESARARELFKRELFGIDESLSRVVDYFKAAAAGSDVGRRLLLLLGPPSGGKSTLAILIKRGLEEYSRTEEGALYAIRGSPLRENPLNLIPTSLRAEFRERYGVLISGELSPWARDFVERDYEGDFVRVPVERAFLTEASRTGIGTYAPHDPTTADIARSEERRV